MASIIETLHVKSVRQFSELDIAFSPSFNIIAGPNGSGKTSILACISHCFYPANFEYSRFQEGSEFWVDMAHGDQKLRVGMGPGSLQKFDYRQSSVARWNALPVSEGRRSILLHEVNSTLKSCPLIIGAQRNLKYRQIQGMMREDTQDRRLQKYLQSNTKSLYGDSETNIKQWIINRYFIVEKDWAVEELENWNHLVAGLPSIGPFDSDFKYVRTGKDLEPVFSIYGRECYLEELSAGFQAVLTIIATIIEWVEGTQPEGSRSARTASGTVLIDELDLHLHPEWQFTLRTGLKVLFPQIQFIVTTHSPHLLASAGNGEVIILPNSYPREKYKISATATSYSGWTTDQVLSDLMGVQSLTNRTYEQLVTSAMKCIEDRNLDELKTKILALEAVCHPENTIVIVLKARLAALEAKKHD